MAVPAQRIMAQMLTGGAAALRPATMNRMAAARFLGDAQSPEGQGDRSPDDQERNAAGPRQGAGDEHDDHEDEQGQDPDPAEGAQRGPDDVVDAAGLVDDRHE